MLRAVGVLQRLVFWYLLNHFSQRCLTAAQPVCQYYPSITVDNGRSLACSSPKPGYLVCCTGPSVGIGVCDAPIPVNLTTNQWTCPAIRPIYGCCASNNYPLNATSYNPVTNTPTYIAAPSPAPALPAPPPPPLVSAALPPKAAGPAPVLTPAPETAPAPPSPPPLPPTLPPTPPPPTASASPVGAIVGGVVGALAAIAAALLMAWYCCIRRPRARRLPVWTGLSAQEFKQQVGPQAEEDPKLVAKQMYVPGKLTNPFEVSITDTHLTDNTSSQSPSQTAKSSLTSTSWTVDGQNHMPTNSKIAGFVGLQDLEASEVHSLSSGTIHSAIRRHPQPEGPAPSGVANVAKNTTGALMEQVDRELPLDLRGLWQISPNDLQIAVNSDGRPVVLGRGAFGTVYRGSLRGMTDVAVKEVHCPDRHHRERFLREIALMRGCCDENIVAFRGAIVGESRTLLVMQYMENGNLYNLLATAQVNNDLSFRWYGRGAAVALDICKGVSFLHSKSIIHLDLKSPNVLLDEHKKAFVADIGLGKVLGGHDTKASAATWYWAAPEQIQGEPCSTAADVFAYGVILWEICSGESPESRYRRPLRVPEECPMHIKTLVESCCSKAPADRPTIFQVFRILTTQPRDSGSGL